MLNSDFKLDKQLLSDCITLGKLDLSTVLLHKDANYLWLILVPQVIDITEFFELTLELISTQF